MDGACSDSRCKRGGEGHATWILGWSVQEHRKRTPSAHGNHQGFEGSGITKEHGGNGEETILPIRNIKHLKDGEPKYLAKSTSQKSHDRTLKPSEKNLRTANVRLRGENAELKDEIAALKEKVFDCDKQLGHLQALVKMIFMADLPSEDPSEENI